MTDNNKDIKDILMDYSVLQFHFEYVANEIANKKVLFSKVIEVINGAANPEEELRIYINDIGATAEAELKRLIERVIDLCKSKL